MLIARSPWDWATVVAEVPETAPEAIAAAVAAMAGAFPGWATRKDRPERLRAFAAVLIARRAALVDLLVREAGKCRADAEAEADLLPRKIAITLDAGMARTPGFAAPRAGEATIAWRARGVAAVLGPFNFPLHLLHGLVVPALAVGCTVVAKPSEHCPALGELYRACLAEAGLDAVATVVQGGRAVAERLVDHPAIATVAAVGGRPTGVALSRRLAARPEVVLALELGGVNHALVLPDADPASAVAAIAEGAWKMAGQRCTATRVVHVPLAALDAWILRLAAARAAWLPAADPNGACGRMISPAARAAFQAPYQALPSGYDLIAGSARSVDERDCAADPLLLVARAGADPAEPLVRDEHFGPALVMLPYRDLDAAIACAAANPYRLAASVFTADPAAFARIAARLPYGQVNHNRPTAGARSELPFGGCGLSGNGRPAAVAANAIFADETVVWG